MKRASHAYIFHVRNEEIADEHGRRIERDGNEPTKLMTLDTQRRTMFFHLINPYPRVFPRYHKAVDNATYFR